MPSLVPQRRSRPADDQSDVESDESEAPEISRRASSKRARLEDDSPSQTPEAPVLPDNYRTSSRANGANGQSSASGPPKHQPGSIVKVSLKNFVTYSAAEFHPGPSLNMVIGPNGTGKSTLVCAICLGLGCKTNVLRRSIYVFEFVKHGAREAAIEIELARDPRRSATNPVIKAVIKRADNKQLWYIDGKSCTHKAVIQLCRSFSIQVDNLCQFLPQDRVVEFAGLSPVDLLAQTQRAAAPEHMVKWHEDLKTMRGDQRKSQQDQQAVTESLKNLEGRQNMQRGDVDRLRERAEIQERVAALHRLRPFPLYNTSRRQYQEAKDRQKTAQQELAALEEEVEPALRAVNNKQFYVNDIKKFVEQRKRVVDRSDKQVKDLFTKQDGFTNNIKQCELEITAEQEAGKKQRQERNRVDAMIRDLKRQIENSKPAEFDAAAQNAEVREITRQIHDVRDQAEALNRKQDDCKFEIGSRNQRIEKARQDIAALRSKAGQQTNKLRQESKDSALAWEWIQRNKDKFSGPVFGPPIIECSVKDQRQAKMVESMLSRAEMLAFTVTNREDFRLLNDSLYSGELRLSDINLRTIETPLSAWKPPVPVEDLHTLGLDGYVLDLIEGPEEVLSMLCDNRNIHATGVAYRDMSDAQYDAIARSPISSWATPSETYVITRRREYGDKGTSTRTQRTKEAKYFTSQPVDTRAEQQLKDTVRELEHEMQTFRQEAEGYKTENMRNGKEHNELKNRKTEMETEKENRQKALSAWNKLPTKLEQQQRKLETLDEAAATFRTRIQEIRKRQEKFTLDRAQEALSIVPSVITLQKMNTEFFDAELMLIEAESDLEVLTLRSQEVRQMLAERKESVKALERVAKDMKTSAARALEQCKAVLNDMSPKEQEIYNALPANQTPEEFEIEIDTTTARLEMVHEGNPHIIREFEERGKQIEKQRGKLERLEAELVALEAKITEVRQQWEPELDALVAQISDAFGDNFARIGCAGQVQVYKDEDFENWAIQVMVRFREHEQLSILDSHRQSGGERAVSTIFYLMALQSLARAPFRVVDEINQGMDPRNERLVHSRIVDIACATHTSQYFLITPKLLPNLMYHPHMKVHCIASGEYMPEDHRQLNFQALATKALGLRAQVG